MLSFYLESRAIAKRKETGLPLELPTRRRQSRYRLPGDRFTVVKDLKKELGPGLLADMPKQLGIRKEDL